MHWDCKRSGDASSRSKLIVQTITLFVSAQTWRDLVAVETGENKIQHNDDVIRTADVLLKQPAENVFDCGHKDWTQTHDKLIDEDPIIN